jgi:hypothetical protein
MDNLGKITAFGKGISYVEQHRSVQLSGSQL